ncbi:MAG: VOC family protein [Clostridia bacterium]|nr:VOC family protein [Clostridia bacterium]NCC76498.1 VOC family protein [Clostridia bacterium]
MKFLWTTLTVTDMDASLAFYQDIVGLKLQRRYVAGPGMEIAFLGEGETQVELIKADAKPAVTIGKDISIGFQVESLDRMLDFVREKGIAVAVPPVQPNPHIRFFYIEDPNGLRVQFVEMM